MKKTILLACALGVCTMGASAIATNYALTLTSGGQVDCGRVASIENRPSYTVQLWLNPSQWNAGARVLSIGTECVLKLGEPGVVILTVGDTEANIPSADLSAGNWTQLTIICDNGNARALVNGAECYSGQLGRIPTENSKLVIGEGFEGRIDDLRLWNQVLSGEHDYFIKNTINRWNPQIDALVAYYKFDQTDCPDIVEQRAIWFPTENAVNNHGVMSKSGVSRSEVTDNAAMKYRLNGAYTANERFYDRAIPREQYLLSNDLIILGIQSFADGHLEYSTPCNHGTFEGAEYMAEYQGRTGVASFDGTGIVDCGKELLNIKDGIYSFEAYIYVDEWIEGAEIFSKMSADGKGLSLTLGGEENHVLTVSVDGYTYSIAKKVDAGKWFHFAFEPSNNPMNNPRDAFNFYIDGAGSRPRPSDVAEIVYQTPTMPTDVPLTLGKGFKGKLDNVTFWKYRDFTAGDFAGHALNGMPMPGFDIVLTSGIMQKAAACYMFDRADNPGFDSYSQDSWLEIMRAAYEGHSGYEIRISVKTPAGYNDSNLINLINNASWRSKFATDLATLAGPYDGVELDLEWVYEWSSYGLLAQEIREKLPADKSFMISCHNVSYKFPKDKMQYVDGFTFQQYGPQKTHSYYSHFESMTKSFVSHGFPKDKIVCSYATTTSRGYNEKGQMSVPISGVRSGFFDGDFEPQEEVDIKDLSNHTYYYCGPLQTYKRARYVVENDIRGIFYWDMGNDVPVAHEYNMAKWCSYALNSNVEPHVTKVEIIRETGVSDISADRTATISLSGNMLSAKGIIELYSTAGAMVARGNDTLNVSSLAAGVYVARSGEACLKFVKKP